MCVWWAGGDPVAAPPTCTLSWVSASPAVAPALLLMMPRRCYFCYHCYCCCFAYICAESSYNICGSAVVLVTAGLEGGRERVGMDAPGSSINTPARDYPKKNFRKVDAGLQ